MAALESITDEASRTTQCREENSSEGPSYKLVTPSRDWVLKAVNERRYGSWGEIHTTPDGASVHIAEYTDGVSQILFGVEVNDADKPFEIMVESKGISIDLIKGNIDEMLKRAVDDFFALRTQARAYPNCDLNSPVKISLNLTTN